MLYDVIRNPKKKIKIGKHSGWETAISMSYQAKCELNRHPWCPQHRVKEKSRILDFRCW